MDGLKKIMYGVTDFPRMRRENAYFVDRTALMPSGLHDEVFQRKTCHAKMNLLFARLKGWKRRIYIVIGEYDNFTNHRKESVPCCQM